MKLHHPLNPAMGTAVVNRLREFTDLLPADGWVAGQAVASALSELFGDGRSVVYNDVDVFRSMNDDDEALRRVKAGDDSGLAIDTCEFQGIDIFEGYTDPLAITLTTRYSVVRTRRNGLLNEILCDFNSTQQNPSVSDSQFLKTFDINAVQVGVNLATGQLCWTASFEQFLRTHQLDIVSLHTPMQSLIRYFRKKRELDGVFGNDERLTELAAMSYALLSRAQQSARPIEAAHCRWQFGEVFAKKLEMVWRDIAPNFDLYLEDVHGHEVTSLVPRFDVDEALMPGCLTAENLPVLGSVISKGLREKYKPNKRDRVSFVASQKVEFPRDLALWKWADLGDSYMDGHVTSGELRVFNRTLRDHSIAKHFIDLPSIGVAMERIRALRKQVEKRGQWVYGLLEQRGRFPADLQAVHLATFRQLYRPVDWDNLDQYLDEEYAYVQTIRKAAPCLPFEIAGYQIRVLETGLEFLQEGADLHHCIGGYAYELLADNSTGIAVSMRKSGASTSQWLTATFSWEAQVSAGENPRVWNLSDIKGVCNREATAKERALIGPILERLELSSLLGARLAKELGDRFPRTCGHFVALIRRLQQKLAGQRRRLEKKWYALGRYIGTRWLTPLALRTGVLHMNRPENLNYNKWFSSTDRLSFWATRAKAIWQHLCAGRLWNEPPSEETLAEVSQFNGTAYTRSELPF